MQGYAGACRGMHEYAPICRNMHKYAGGATCHAGVTPYLCKVISGLCMLHHHSIGRSYFENIRGHLIKNGLLSRVHGNVKRMPR